jgi:ribosomal protein S18 acetylase RimI-like enzyme
MSIISPPATNVELRLANEKDLPAIADLWIEMMREHEAFEPRLRITPHAVYAYHSYLMLHVRGPKSVVVVMEDGGTIIGFCCAYVCQNLPMFLPAEFGYVSDIYVCPAYQHQGVGERLMRYIRQFFKGCGVQSVQLQVYRHNPKGQAFWKKQGFENFFDRMWLDLGQADHSE